MAAVVIIVKVFALFSWLVLVCALVCWLAGNCLAHVFFHAAKPQLPPSAQLRSPPGFGRASSHSGAMGKGGAGFRSKDLHGGIEFKGLTKQAAVVVKRHMKKRHAEQAGTKSSVDQGSLEFTEGGFRVRFKQPCTVAQAYAWLKRKIDKLPREEQLEASDWTYAMLADAPAASAGAGSSHQASVAAASAGPAPQASVAPSACGSRAPTLKLLRAGIQIPHPLFSGNIWPLFASMVWGTVRKTCSDEAARLRAPGPHKGTSNSSA